MVRKKAAVCGEERRVRSLKTAAKETSPPKAYVTMPIGIMGRKSLALID